MYIIWNEIGLIFRLLPRYTLLLSFEDGSSTKGKKKSEELVSLAVCANAIGTHKIPNTLIGIPKFSARVKVEHGLLNTLVRTKHG